MLTIANLKHNCNFSFGLVNISKLPTQEIGEVCFWGRSNVGKSSIINAVTCKRKLARVSNTPGRTQEINFFALQDSTNTNTYLHIVDLPGYGYAKVSKTSAYKWAKTTEQYITKSLNLRKIYLLIDSKVGFKQIDYDVMEFLDYYGKLYQIVFTKHDKATAEQIQKNTAEFNNTIAKKPACFGGYIATSTTKKIGIEELQNNILHYTA